MGYVDFSGGMDTCIALRTLVVKDGVASMQAGGGIVADSTPDGEYAESYHKMRALLRAIELAERLEATENGAPGGLTMILLIDNYDSFTFNLYQYLAELGADGRRRPQRPDHPRRDRRDAAGTGPDRHLAGSLHPSRGRVSRSPLVKRFAGRMPILGVCLGHQAIGAAFGGTCGARADS